MIDGHDLDLKCIAVSYYFEIKLFEKKIKKSLENLPLIFLDTKQYYLISEVVPKIWRKSPKKYFFIFLITDLGYEPGFYI